MVARRLNKNNVLLTIYQHTLCTLPSSPTAVNRRINVNHRVEAISAYVRVTYIPGSTEFQLKLTELIPSEPTS